MLAYGSGTEFLFNNAIRIADPDYKPTDDDTCWARAKTTGIEKVLTMIQSPFPNLRCSDLLGYYRCSEDIEMYCL